MATTPHVLFAGGGAAGHLHPGLAVAEHLRRKLPGAVIHGDSQLYAFAWAFEGVDMGAVAAAMGKRGWVCGQTTSPKGIHVMATPVHEPYADEYVAAVAECVELVRSGTSSDVKAAAYN